MKIYYSVINGDDPTFDPVGDENFEYDIFGDYWEGSYDIEQIAKDYFYNYEDCEDAWPFELRIWDENGKHLGDYEVHMSYEPSFHVMEKK